MSKNEKLIGAAERILTTKDLSLFNILKIKAGIKD